MKEFMKKTCVVIFAWILILAFLPMAMWRIGLMIFKQEDADVGTLFFGAAEDYFKGL